MLRPSKSVNELVKGRSPGHDRKRPNSLALTPKRVIKSEPELKRSGFDWQTYAR